VGELDSSDSAWRRSGLDASSFEGEMMEVSTAFVMVMLVMMGGMVAGGAWAMLRRRKRDDDG
jgi:LPXTG-motif cell wall-anchored protein